MLKYETYKISLGQEGMNLTRTGLIVLISVIFVAGAGTAYAGMVLPMITFAANTHTTGDASVDGDLSVGTNDGADDDSILFDDGTKVLRWDDSVDRFEISEDLALDGIIEAGIDTEGMTQMHTDYHRFGQGLTSHGLAGDNDFFINGKFEVNGVSFFDGGLTCPGCIDTGDIAGGAVTSTKIETAAVGSDEIAADAVGGSEIIGTSKLLFAKCTFNLPSLLPSTASDQTCTVNGVAIGDEVVGSINSAPKACLTADFIQVSTNEIQVTFLNTCASTTGAATITGNFIVFNI